ncbi:MAG: MBL fold metallo-hydrolase [bacterium]|nr:MBL fold metallo-hydrolase [bacterium]
MEEKWTEIVEKVRKELDEAVNSLIQQTFSEVEELLKGMKNKAQELTSKAEEENLTPEKINETIQKTLQELIETKGLQIEEALKAEEENLRKEVQEMAEKIRQTIENRIKEVEAEIDSQVKSVFDPERVRGLLEEKIKTFIEEKSHLFEDDLKTLGKEVVDKNQKDIKKNLEKSLKAFYEAEDGLKKIIGEIVKNQSDYITSQLQEKISEMLSTSAKELLLESPLSERIAEYVGFEMKKYMQEIENIKATLDVLEMRIKILSETPGSSEERPPSEKEEIEIPQAVLFPEDEGVREASAEEKLETKPENVTEEVQVPPVEEQASEVFEETSMPAEATEETVEVTEERKERLFKLQIPIEITYFGHAAFLITANNTKIITDPYKHMALNGSIKYQPIDVEADFVTVSHMHMDQGAWKEIPGNPKLVEVAGEKSFSDFPFLKFKGIQTYHDNAEGNVRGANMVFNIEIAGIKITHLGALGHILTKEQLREIGKPVDIIFIPVGGYDTLPIRDAWEVVEQLDPLVVIPMRFKTDACELPLAEVDAFLSLAKCPVKVMESTIFVDSLPTSREVWVLKPLKI